MPRASRPSPKQLYLDALDREYPKTMRVLRAYPADRLDLRPHPTCRTAAELAWTFVLERGLGTMVFNDEFADIAGSGQGAPPAPDSLQEILSALEAAQADFREMVESTSDRDLKRKVRFFTAPQQMGEVGRMEWLWFLLHDEIHHRGQFSIYLRMADGKVPSIYGPSADEPWT